MTDKHTPGESSVEENAAALSMKLSTFPHPNGPCSCGEVRVVDIPYPGVLMASLRITIQSRPCAKCLCLRAILPEGAEVEQFIQCSDCYGRGTVRDEEATAKHPNPYVMVEKKCPTCKGGAEVEKPEGEQP